MCKLVPVLLELSVLVPFLILDKHVNYLCSMSSVSHSPIYNIYIIIKCTKLLHGCSFLYSIIYVTIHI